MGEQITGCPVSAEHTKRGLFGLGTRGFGAVFLIVGILVFINTLSNPFVHDDIVFIRHNPTIADLSRPWSFFWNPTLSLEDSSVINAYYRPLLEIVYRLEYRLFGFNPAGYHLVNVLLHVFNGFLVFLSVLKILARASSFQNLGFKDQGLAFAVGIVFLVHPVQSEAVASIVGISNLLSAFFILLSFYLYVGAGDDGAENSRTKTIGAILSFAVALACKEMAVVLPVVLFLLEIGIPLPREKRHFRWLRLAPFWAVLLGYFFLRDFALGRALPPLMLGDDELWLRVLAIPGILVTFIGIIAWPVGLHYYRSWDILQPWAPWALALAGIIFVMAGAIGYARGRRGVMAFGLLWFLVVLAPTLNIVPMINEYSQVLAAEHFLYLPLMGLLLSLAVPAQKFGEEFFKSQWPRVAAFSLGGLVLILSGICFRQNSYWLSETALFERMIRYEKGFGRGHMLLARAYYFRQNWAKALEHYRIAGDIMDGYRKKSADSAAEQFYADYLKQIHFESGHAYEGRGEMTKALEEYRQALMIAPRDSKLYNSAGVASLRQHKFDEAAAYFHKAVEVDPQNFMAMTNLAVSYIYLKKPSEAEALLIEVLRLNPNYNQARVNLQKLRRNISDPYGQL